MISVSIFSAVRLTAMKKSEQMAVMLAPFTDQPSKFYEALKLRKFGEKSEQGRYDHFSAFLVYVRTSQDLQH
jgi:hypothetical protein